MPTQDVKDKKVPGENDDGRPSPTADQAEGDEATIDEALRQHEQKDKQQK
jgi:hypothetical protein